MQDEISMEFNPDLSRESILAFLNEVDADFPVPLSEKVDLAEYAGKLSRLADLVVFVDGAGDIKAMAAGYVRNSSGPLSYLSLLAVSRDSRGSGAGSKLVSRFVEEAERNGLLGVHLYADEGNPAALRTYEKLGFSRAVFSEEARPADAHFLKLTNKTALVTAIGSFSASCVIDSLHSDGFRVVGCDIYPREWIANSLKVDAFYQVPLASDKAQYLEALNRIIASERIGYVVPLTDYEVDALCGEKLGAMVCMSADDSIAVCRDKLACYDLLREDFPNSVIPTLCLAKADLGEMDYPIVCKPRRGRSSEGLFKLDSGQSLAAIAPGLDLSVYCVQPQVRGNVVTVDVVRDAMSGRSVAVPREELIRTPNGAGVSVRVFDDRPLADLASGIAERLGVCGCVNIEFIAEPGGSYRFLECNPRFSGGVEFSCMAGYDCVSNHLRCFLGIAPEPFCQEGEQYMARSYEAHIMDESQVGRGSFR